MYSVYSAVGNVFGLGDNTNDSSSSTKLADDYRKRKKSLKNITDKSSDGTEQKKTHALAAFAEHLQVLPDSSGDYNNTSQITDALESRIAEAEVLKFNILFKNYLKENGFLIYKNDLLKEKMDVIFFVHTRMIAMSFN